MARGKADTVRGLVALFATRKTIETGFRNFAVAQEQEGNAEVGVVFRKLIESDIVDRILEDSGTVISQMFSKRELEEVYAFFGSPTGRKWMASVPGIQERLTLMTQDYVENEIKKELGEA